jgi:phosphoglycerate dehydrogenase-like enzyme
MNIVVLDDFEKNLVLVKEHPVIASAASMTVHHQPLQGKALLEAVLPAHILVLMRDRTPLKKELIDQLPNLKYVIFTGNRNLAIDYGALKERNIPVSFTEFGPSKETTVEITWTLILGAYKRLIEQNQLVKDGLWRNAYSVMPPLHGERLGVLGLGAIGGRVAQVGLAFGMDVVTWSPHMTPERAAAKGVKAVSLEELLATSRIVTLHLVPGEGTRYLMDAKRLAMMRPDSLLVNTSRSALIVTSDLLAALKVQRPAMAALDVFDVEPLTLADPITQVPNLLITPHLGFVSQPVFAKMREGLGMAIAAFLQDQAIVNEVKPT